MRDDSPARVKAVLDVATFAEGLVGAVTKLDLVDLLQLLIMNRHSRALFVQGSHFSGELVIQDGDIVDARCNGDRGEKALFKILGQRGGHFVEQPMPPQVERTIEGRGQMLLLEAMRLRDEQARHGGPA
jgi:hypothetical protein